MGTMAVIPFTWFGVGHGRPRFSFVVFCLRYELQSIFVDTEAMLRMGVFFWPPLMMLDYWKGPSPRQRSLTGLHPPLRVSS